jgi:lactate dehydrogenase-like 2-hydroxyacid dehydrogenase
MIASIHATRPWDRRFLAAGHQAFFTEEAVRQIAETTITNLHAAERGIETGREVTEALVT